MLHGFIPLAGCGPLSVGATVACQGRVCAVGVSPQAWDLVYRVGAACELAALAAGPCLGSKPGGTSARRISLYCV